MWVGSQLIRYYCVGGATPSTTVVGRDVASAVATLTVDTVDVHIQTRKAIASASQCLPSPPNPRDPACYTFDVSASRRTPALRIWAQPS